LIKYKGFPTSENMKKILMKLFTTAKLRYVLNFSK